MKNIYIIEDDLDMREVMADAIVARGYSVHSFETSEEALQSVTSEKPDLILLDVMTHSLHASVFLERLRQLPDAKGDSPVIIISNVENQITRDKTAKFNIAAYLIKANTPLDTLLGHIKETIGEP